MGKQRDAEQYEARRFEAIRLFKEGVAQADIARRLGVTRQSVSRWVKTNRRSGARGLRRKPRSGRPPKLTRSQQRALLRALARGARAAGYTTELWTAERIRRLVREKFDVVFHVNHVPKLLHQLGWSYQRPVGRALERDEEAVKRWLETDWPRIKKKSVARARS